MWCLLSYQPWILTKNNNRGCAISHFFILCPTNLYHRLGCWVLYSDLLHCRNKINCWSMKIKYGKWCRTNFLPCLWFRWLKNNGNNFLPCLWFRWLKNNGINLLNILYAWGCYLTVWRSCEIMAKMIHHLFTDLQIWFSTQRTSVINRSYRDQENRLKRSVQWLWSTSICEMRCWTWINFIQRKVLFVKR